MQAIYSSLGRRLLLTGLGLIGTYAVQAQNLNYGLSSAAISTGTFTNLGTTGTAIVVSDEDDDNSSAQNIGFTFGYNGQTFTQFVLNTNGALKLGSTPPADAYGFFDFSTDPADVNMLFPFHVDLVGSSPTTGFRYINTGTAPNRICTIQWTDMTEYDAPEQFTNFSFQVKLYETTNAIEFVYGSSTPGASSINFAAVGLKGAGPNTGQVLLATKASTAAPSAATFQTTGYTTQAFDYSTATMPTAGYTLRFTPTVTATRDAQLARALSVYPNPSTGTFTLNLRDAGTAALQVEVSNALGQRVYAGSVRDNGSTPLELSGLANGLYSLKVNRGNSYAVRTITIQK